MATFTQWRRLFINEREMKRAYFVCGPDRVHVEEVVDEIRKRISPGDLDFSHLFVSEVKPRVVWDAINAYPADPDTFRLVITREAELIKDWNPFIDWIESRHIPQVIAVFVSNEVDPDTAQPHIQKFVKSGRFVRCGPCNDDDAIKWLESIAEVNKDSALYLLQRVDGDLYDAANTLKKASLLGGTVNNKVIDILMDERPSSAYVDWLMKLNKKRAFQSVSAIDDRDIGRIIGQLDYKLDQVTRVAIMHRRGQSPRDIINTTKIKPFLVADMLGYIRHYDKRSSAERVETLAFIDHHFNNGVREGLLVTLTSMW